MDKARSFKNLPCAALTEISGKPSSRLCASAFSSASSFDIRKELWYSSERVQSFCDDGVCRPNSAAVDIFDVSKNTCTTIAFDNFKGWIISGRMYIHYIALVLWAF